MMRSVGTLLLVLAALLVCVDSSCTYHSRLRRNAERRQPHSRTRRSVTCSSSDAYRKIDGTCNNLNEPEWGSTDTEFLRLLDPVYDDDIGTPRAKATNGNDLPNPRTISNNVHFELSFASNKHTAMLMQWGQFIDHDITKTPQVEDNGEEIDCCSRSDSVTSNSSSPCFRIDVPNGDGYYNDGKCINLVRSEAFSGTGTNTSNPRQQYNALTSFIDASMIYGTTDAETASLRDSSSNSGLLKVLNTNFLPEGSNTSCFLNTSDSSNYCFLAGDPRVNVYFGLSALHTLFLREHNRIATELHSWNPSWDDEKLFQETRRIVAAELQIITYNNFLPEILSNDGIANYSLGKGNYVYNSSINPSFSNVFSTAAFRYGHSQVPENHTIGSTVVDTAELFKRTKYVLNSIDDVFEGLVTDASERADAWYVDGMRNQMFETDSQTKDGLDIVALNIQRGREHGLPPYNEWREYCDLNKITDFLSDSDFGLIQGRDLRDTYNDVDDIDLYSGAIAEIPFESAVVGRTYICLLGEQFRKLRDGDRFWYETTDTTVGFTSEQITQLEKQSLADIICDNTDLTQVQRNVFKQANANNPLTQCSNMRGMNLRKWKE